MKHKFSTFSTLLLLATVLQLTSCKKFVDKYFPGHGHGNGKVDDYRIKKLAFTYRAAASGPKQTGIVYYNQQNNPDSIIFDDGLSSNGDPTIIRDVYFTYNSDNKLTRVYYPRYYGEGSNSYSYDSNGRIYSDTTRILDVGAREYYISYPTYDNYGRVISEEIYVYESGGFTYYDNPIHRTVTYNYDNKGNLVRNRSPFTQEPVVYDNKINYLRTNEIWMFLARNYSRNNPNAASGYNQAGLPLGFRNGVVFSFLGFGDPYEIQYEKID